MNKTKNNIVSILRKVIYLPTLLVFFVVLSVYILSNLHDLFYTKDEEAKRIATVVAYTASSQPQVEGLLQLQVESMLKLDPTITSITFFPLDKTLPNANIHKKNNHNNLYNILIERYLTQYAPVTIGLSQQQPQLLGYINVTIDMNKAKSALFKRYLAVILGLASLLACLYFLVFFASHKLLYHLIRLGKVSQDILDDKIDGYVVSDTEQSITKELFSIELALADLSNKLVAAEKNMAEMQVQHKQVINKDKQLNIQQSSFQAMITHELKTPLNAIMGGVQLLSNHYMSEAQQDAMQIVRQGVDRLDNVLEQIMQLNKLDQGKIQLNNTVFSPKKLLKQVVETYRTEAEAKNLNVVLDIKHTLYELEGDKQKIIEVLSLLVDNAIKFTIEGAVTLISEITHLSSGVRWSISVVDTGIGIDEKLYDDIFTPFFQIDPSSTREFDGSGVGLALAKQLTVLMQGELSVSSQLTQGSVFTLVLNLKDKQEFENNHLLQGCSVIYYQSTVVETIADSLKKSGATISVVDNLPALRAAQADNPVDLLVISKHVTVKQATAIAKEWRQHEDKHRVIMCYFATNVASLDAISLGNAGIDYCLEDSLTEQQIIHTFAQWLV